jgi:hypothetical protein
MDNFLKMFLFLPAQLSPPIVGGLKPGDNFIGEIFPLVYGTVPVK